MRSGWVPLVHGKHGNVHGKPFSLRSPQRVSIPLSTTLQQIIRPNHSKPSPSSRELLNPLSASFEEGTLIVVLNWTRILRSFFRSPPSPDPLHTPAPIQQLLMRMMMMTNEPKSCRPLSKRRSLQYSHHIDTRLDPRLRHKKPQTMKKPDKPHHNTVMTLLKRDPPSLTKPSYNPNSLCTEYHVTSAQPRTLAKLNDEHM